MTFDPDDMDAWPHDDGFVMLGSWVRNVAVAAVVVVVVALWWVLA